MGEQPVPLDPAALTVRVVRPGGPWREVRVVPRTGSTNADLAAEARRGAAGGLVLAAEHQQAGRGRLDRTWESPPGAGLTFSVLLRPDAVPAARWPWLPLLVGLAAAEATRGLTGVPVDLKWPNDLLVEGRKLAGVLVERVASPAGPAAVAGLGLNVSTAAGDLPAGGTSLAAEGSPADRGALLVAVLDALGDAYARWCADRGDPHAWLRDAYRARCVTLGGVVRVHLPVGGLLEGTAEDVDEAGRLLVAAAGRRVAVGAGDVVHVR